MKQHIAIHRTATTRPSFTLVSHRPAQWLRNESGITIDDHGTVSVDVPSLPPSRQSLQLAPQGQQTGITCHTWTLRDTGPRPIYGPPCPDMRPSIVHEPPTFRTRFPWRGDGTRSTYGMPEHLRHQATIITTRLMTLRDGRTTLLPRPLYHVTIPNHVSSLRTPHLEDLANWTPDPSESLRYAIKRPRRPTTNPTR